MDKGRWTGVGAGEGIHKPGTRLGASNSQGLDTQQLISEKKDLAARCLAGWLDLEDREWTEDD